MDKNMMKYLNVLVLQPRLECAVDAWSPCRMKNIKKIEETPESSNIDDAWLMI